MSYDLEPIKKLVRDECINQSVWPPIWRWLCGQYNGTHLPALPYEFIRKGQYNSGLEVDATVAERMAEILEKRNPATVPSDVYDLLEERGLTPHGSTRVERLIRFFRASGGFRIW